MGVGIVRDGVANFFDVLKRFTENLEGIDKIAGIVQPLIALIKLQYGPIVPESILNILDDLKVVKVVKNASFCIYNADEAFKKPFSFKDFMTVGSLVNLAKRICFIGASIFMLGEYFERITKVATPYFNFPWKMVLLLGGVALSAIKGIIDLYENSANAAKLSLERQFHVKNNSLTAQQIDAKKAEVGAEVQKLQTSLADVFAKNVTKPLAQSKSEVEDLERKATENKPAAELKQIQEKLALEQKVLIELKAKDLLGRVNNIAVAIFADIAVAKFADIDKQKDMLKLLKNDSKRPQQDALNDVETLLTMNEEQFRAHKFSVFDVRQANLSMARSRTWHAIAYDVSKVVVFSIILVKAPMLSLVPSSFVDLAHKGIESIGLVSGLLGGRKFIFDSYNKPKDEPRPIIAA